MADHSKPSVTSNYSLFVNEMSARFNDLAVGLNPNITSPTNLPLNSIRLYHDANTTKWQKLTEIGWYDVAAAYDMNINGNATTVTNGIYTTGSYSNPAWITGLAGSKISGDISGNSASTTKLATARNINGVAFDGTAAISINLNNSVTVSNAGNGAVSGSGFNGGSNITISYNSVGAPSTTGAGASGTWGISITGSAASATNATNIAISNDTTNAATVYPVWVTGTSSSTGLKISSTKISFVPSSGILTAEGFSTGQYGLTGVAGGGGMFNGTGDGASSTIANVQIKSWFGIGFAPSISGQAVPQGENAVWIDVRSGSIGARGDIYTSGNISANSDETLKTNWRELPENFVAKLAQVKYGVYDRVDSNLTQVGVSAQSLQPLLPHAITKGTNGKLAVAYGNAALVSAIELAREIELLKQEIKLLKGGA